MQGLRFFVLPIPVGVVDAAGEARGDVDGGGDAAVAASAQGVEQERLGAGEDGEVGELPAERGDALRIPRAILRADHDAGVGLEEA